MAVVAKQPEKTGVNAVQMVEPDYWKGRGRYSKQALSRKVTNSSVPYKAESSEDSQEAK
jgi:hypothetical protein